MDIIIKKQVYHHYEKWEEYKYGMWSVPTQEEVNNNLQKAIDFTGNHELYGNAMLKVIKQWPVSCEQNLTNSSINQQAWIGHAAVCLELGIPESITRKAWGFLTKEQQSLANKEADKAILAWNNQYYGENQNELF